MSKLNSLLLVLALGLTSGVVLADGNQGAGNLPGYVFTPASGSSVIKSGYGQCVHTMYYNADDGVDACGEAPKKAEVTTIQKVNFSESGQNLFNFDSSELSPAGKQELTRLVNAAESKGALSSVTKVIVEGNTDKIGGYSYNQNLSADRAGAVKDFLISLGIDSGKITAVGNSYDKSFASDACFKKYGLGPELAKLSAVDDSLDEDSTPAEHQRVDAEWDKFTRAHVALIQCTAPDRRVDISVEQTVMETVSQ